LIFNTCYGVHRFLYILRSISLLPDFAHTMLWGGRTNESELAVYVGYETDAERGSVEVQCRRFSPRCGPIPLPPQHPLRRVRFRRISEHLGRQSEKGVEMKLEWENNSRHNIHRVRGGYWWHSRWYDPYSYAGTLMRGHNVLKAGMRCFLGLG